MIQRSIAILLISNAPEDVNLITQALDFSSLYQIRQTPTLLDALSFLEKSPSDLILLDVDLTVEGGEDPVKILRESYPHIPIMVLMDDGDDELALQAASRGAQDYVVRNALNTHFLPRSLAYVLERHHMMERLERSSEERFRQIIEKSADGMVVVDLEGIVRFINPAVEQIFERTASNIIGQRFDFHILTRQGGGSDGRMDELSLRYVSLLAKTGKSTEMEISLDGDVIKLVEMRATDIQWDMKPAYLVVFHDITSLMRLQRLKAEIFERERISKLKDEFISTVSHELRTPLAIVKCAIENMKDGVTGPLSDKQEKIVRIASGNVDRLTKLIDDILDLSRLEAGTVKITQRLVAVDALVQETVRRFALLAREQGIEIEADVQPPLPEIYADGDKITQVLDNLLGNALRFARKKIILRLRSLGPVLAIGTPLVGEFMHFQNFVSSQVEGVQISIIDDGPGISREKLGQLFNKFVQIDRPSGGAGYKGTGLGLAISKEIVELHQGKIWAESDIGQGAQFHFILPRFHDAQGSDGPVLST